MLDFTPLRNKEKTIMDLAQGLSRDDLRRLLAPVMQAKGMRV